MIPFALIAALAVGDFVTLPNGGGGGGVQDGGAYQFSGLEVGGVTVPQTLPNSCVDGGTCEYTGLTTNVLASDAGILGTLNVIGQSVLNGPTQVLSSLTADMIDAGPSSIIGNAFPPPDTGTATILYTAASGGSDSNACTSIGAPCATIQGVINKVPKILEHGYTILVGDGGYAAGAYIMGYQASVGNYTPATVTPGPGITIQAATGIASASGAMSGTLASSTLGGVPRTVFVGLTTGPANYGTATVTDAGWTTNALAGLLFCSTGGFGSGQCMEIYSNTATVATIVGSWGRYAPRSGSTFEIEIPQTSMGCTLAKPQGSMSVGQSIATSAFYFAGNGAAPGYSPAFGDPLGSYDDDNFSLFGDAGVLTGTSFAEPLFAVKGFRFSCGDSASAFALSGANEYVDIENNVDTDGGVFVRAANGASYLAVANNIGNDAFGNVIFKNVGPGGQATIFGNYISYPSSGGFTEYVLNYGAQVLSLQNYVAENDGLATEEGIQNGFTGTPPYQLTVLSNGDEFSGLAFAIDFREPAILQAIGTDFTNNTEAIRLQQGSSARLGLGGVNSVVTGSNNGTCFEVDNSSLALNGTTCNADAGGNQIDVGTLYGGVYFGYSDLDAGPPAKLQVPISDMSFGAGRSSTVSP